MLACAHGLETYGRYRKTPTLTNMGDSAAQAELIHMLDGRISSGRPRVIAVLLQITPGVPGSSIVAIAGSQTLASDSCLPCSS